MRRQIHFRPALISGAIFLAALLLSAVLFLPRLPGVNAASLEYFRSLIAGSAPSETALAGHPRAGIWQAVALFGAGRDAELVAGLPPAESLADPFTLQIAAQAYLRLGEYGQAVELLGRIGSVRQLLEAARRAVEAGAPDAAEAAFQYAFAIDPIESTAPMADFLLNQKQDPDAAVALLRAAVERTDNHRLTPYWLLRLAGILESEGRWLEAADAHAAAIEKNGLMNPSEQQLYRRYLDMAWALHMAKRPIEANDALQQAVAEFTPDDGRTVYFWERAGQIYERGGRAIAAVDAYMRVLQVAPDNEIALAGLERLAGMEKNNGE